jgi:hypothetical protein
MCMPPILEVLHGQHNINHITLNVISSYINDKTEQINDNAYFKKDILQCQSVFQHTGLTYSVNYICNLQYLFQHFQNYFIGNWFQNFEILYF